VSGGGNIKPGSKRRRKAYLELYDTLRAGLELTETPVALLFRRSSPINGMTTTRQVTPKSDACFHLTKRSSVARTPGIRVRSINQGAFGRPDEADLVERLWSEGVVLVSLVAEVRRQIVGHILFSRMSIDTARASIPAVALAPMAVLPEYQRQAIGGQLIRGGLDLLFGQGEQIVLVLGHPTYYPRFGFSAEMALS
jgi:predicted N-acetyltransferase YhbS